MTEACKVAVPKTADPVLKMFFGSMQKFSLIILLSDHSVEVIYLSDGLKNF